MFIIMPAVMNPPKRKPENQHNNKNAHGKINSCRVRFIISG